MDTINTLKSEILSWKGEDISCLLKSIHALEDALLDAGDGVKIEDIIDITHLLNRK